MYTGGDAAPPDVRADDLRPKAAGAELLRPMPGDAAATCAWLWFDLMTTSCVFCMSVSTVFALSSLAFPFFADDPFSREASCSDVRPCAPADASSARRRDNASLPLPLPLPGAGAGEGEGEGGEGAPPPPAAAAAAPDPLMELRELLRLLRVYTADPFMGGDTDAGGEAGAMESPGTGEDEDVENEETVAALTSFRAETETKPNPEKKTLEPRKHWNPENTGTPKPRKFHQGFGSFYCVSVLEQSNFST